MRIQVIIFGLTIFVRFAYAFQCYDWSYPKYLGSGLGGDTSS
jgi:hypothetical protein